MTDTVSQENTARHGSSAWRRIRHIEIVGPHWFEINTTLARTMALSFRAAAKVHPDTIAALDDEGTLDVPLDEQAGYVRIIKLGKKASENLGASFLGVIPPNADGSFPDRKDLGERGFLVPVSWHERLHATKDPFFAADQMVAALLSFACGANRDREMLANRDRLFYECPSGPKRMLFTLCRGHQKDMQAKWANIRELLADVHWRGAPLIAPYDGELHLAFDSRAVGPFKKEALMAYRVSRHVFEDAKKVDGALDAIARYHPRKQKKSPRPPAHPDDGGPATRGATSIDPRIFDESASGICGQMAMHVHAALNSSSKDQALSVWRAVSGRAVVRAHAPRPSRRKKQARRIAERAIKKGSFAPRSKDEKEIPLLRRAGREYVLAFDSPRAVLRL